MIHYTSEQIITGNNMFFIVYRSIFYQKVVSGRVYLYILKIVTNVFQNRYELLQTEVDTMR